MPKKDDAVQKYNPNAVIGSPGNLKALVSRDDFKTAVREMAPKHLDTEKLTRIVLTAASRNPTLLKCTQASILKAAIEATTLGLDCSGLLGRGYLVPYRNGKLGPDVFEAQFQAGYLGLVDLARRSGEIEDVQAVAVFEGDHFEYECGLDYKLVHRPSADPEAAHTKETLRWVYAVAVFKSGYRKPHVMSIPEVEAIRKRSRAANSGPWVTDYVAMALKTCVRQLCKFLPQSVDLQTQLQREIEFDADDAINGAIQAEAITLEPTDGREPAFGFAEDEEEKGADGGEKPPDA